MTTYERHRRRTQPVLADHEEQVAQQLALEWRLVDAQNPRDRETIADLINPRPNKNDWSWVRVYQRALVLSGYQPGRHGPPRPTT